MENKIIDILYKINPDPNLFKNKTQRKYISELIKQFGIEKVEAMANKAVKAYESLEMFAPVITTPLELRSKWAKLERYNPTEQSNQFKCQYGNFHPKGVICGCSDAKEFKF